MSLVDQEPVLFNTTIFNVRRRKTMYCHCSCYYKKFKDLLLDEATSALDTHGENIVQDALDKASKNRISQIIHHTKIIVMNQGTIMEIGDHEELMEKKKDHHLGRAIADLSASSTILSKRKADLEAGMKHDYKYTREILKKVGKINRPEISQIIIGLLAAIVCGSVYPVFAIIFSHILQPFSKLPDQLKHEAIFWSLNFLVIAVVFNWLNCIRCSFWDSGANLIKRIRSLSFASMLRQDIEFYDDKRNSVGALASALSEDATRVNGLAVISDGKLHVNITGKKFNSSSDSEK
ncbi:hypothetical protein Glove_505g38 [Diversispora epigaea]|uniref:ABC transmembrane type-1 domain-containing protein n=1 Tax=Diversispora epigaea TaxID=1348612 RepID=A0A397GKU6_9GLOM|nr:hypothetical protein Glove_505g38 [Diversispora epigaea]